MSRVFVTFRNIFFLVENHSKQQAAASRSLMRIASGSKPCLYTDSKQYSEAAYVVQQAAYSGSKQCSTVYSNGEKCSKQQQHKELRVPTASSSDTQLLLLYEVTTTAAA